jgi:hypothetical protein
MGEMTLCFFGRERMEKSIILLERFYVLLSRPSDRSGSLMKKLEW